MSPKTLSRDDVTTEWIAPNHDAPEIWASDTTLLPVEEYFRRSIDLVVLRAGSPNARRQGMLHSVSGNAVKAFDEGFRRYTRHSEKELLAILTGSFGMTWVAISRALGVSVPAVRKWRLDGNASTENHQGLAELVAFLDASKAAGISDPARWFVTPMLAGYEITPLTIYSELTAQQSLGLLQPDRVTEVMDDALTNWREEFATDFEVATEQDGEQWLRHKS